MHRTTVLPKKRTNRHEHFYTGHARCSEGFLIVYIDYKIHIDEKPIVLLLYEHNITYGNVMVKDSGI